MVGGLEKRNPELINQALEKMAKAFAFSLMDAEMRRLLKFEIGKKFDGDYNVLYNFVRDFRFKDGRSFEEKVSCGYARFSGIKDEEAILSVKKLADLIPEWDEENYISLVAYRHVGIDDRDVKFVNAYDFNGLLDTWKKPGS